MPGGLLNIVAYGSANVILNGNPKKTFFKTVYKKYTNFGLQRFRLDFEGQRNLSFNSDTTLEFKVKRFAELLWDSYIVVNLPDIWSPFYPRPDLHDENFGKINVVPYEFQWIQQLGFNMIKKVTIHSGGMVLDEYSGEWMQNVIERDEEGKKKLVSKMIGHVPELYDPANALGRNGFYPNAVYDTNCYKLNMPPQLRGEVPSGVFGIEPSIRGQKLYIPLLAWFCHSSKISLPLVALQYQEVFIRIEFRSVRELFTIRYVNQPKNDLIYTCPKAEGMPSSGLGARKAPNSASVNEQLWLFLQPPPPPKHIPEGTIDCPRDLKAINIDNKNGWKNWLATWEQYPNKTNQWNTDIHLISTYIFLGNDERRQFAAKEHQYLIKAKYEHDYLNSTGSQRIKIPSNNMISSYMFRWRRSDANIRNEWNNYSNWPYKDTLPHNLYAWDGKHATNLLEPDGISSFCANPAGWLVTGCLQLNNVKDILLNLGILLGGEYRENIHDAGIYNYIEKYKRTRGHASDGLYMYNFCINTHRSTYQPSGAQNTDKWKDVVFEFNTLEPPKLDCWGDSANIDILCDSVGEIIGVRKDIWRLREYNYDLRIFEERYNVINIKGGKIGLLHAR